MSRFGQSLPNLRGSKAGIRFGKYVFLQPGQLGCLRNPSKLIEVVDNDAVTFNAAFMRTVHEVSLCERMMETECHAISLQAFCSIGHGI